jgi:hypothetical protein
MKKLLLIVMIVFSYASTEFYTYSLKLNYKEYVNGKVIDRDYSKLGDILGIGIKYTNHYVVDYYLKQAVSNQLHIL